jgi:hypothetical protein
MSALVRPGGRPTAQRARVGDKSFTAVVWHHWPTGQTVYRLRGPRVEGSFTIAAATPASRADEPAAYTAARVEFGWPGDAFSPTDAQDRPRVNGVQLWGGVTVEDWSVMPGPAPAPSWSRHIHRTVGDRWEQASGPTRLFTAQLCWRC